MADMAAMGGDDALAFMVSAGLVYEVIAAACSSPQTTEINAKTRSGTLMKWVVIGGVQAAALVIIAASISKRPGPTLLGGGTAIVLMGAQYWHARDAGLKSNAPGTEG
jgi:hypothetical protein